MAKKKAKKSFVSPTQLLVDAFEEMELDESKKTHLGTLRSKIEDEVRNLMMEFASRVDDEITRVRSHFLDVKVMVPSKIRDLTVGEIVAAGGSFQFQGTDDDLVVNVPTQMFADPAVADSLTSSLMIINSAKKASRPVLNDATNSVRRTGLRSTVKRSRIPTGMTPGSSKRGKNMSISGNMSSFVIPSTGRITRSTARKVVPNKAHTKPAVTVPSNGNTETYVTPKGVKSAVVEKSGAMYQFAVVNNVTINNINKNDGDTNLVNPKTPGGSNLFRKLPRVPDPGEDMNIVVYSNQGTPLVVDPVEVIARSTKYGTSSQKSITNK